MEINILTGSDQEFMALLNPVTLPLEQFDYGNLHMKTGSKHNL